MNSYLVYDEKLYIKKNIKKNIIEYLVVTCN